MRGTEKKIDRYLDRGGEKQIKKPRDTYGDMEIKGLGDREYVSETEAETAEKDTEKRSADGHRNRRSKTAASNEQWRRHTRACQSKFPDRKTSALTAALAAKSSDTKMIYQDFLTGLAAATNDLSMPCHKQRPGAATVNEHTFRGAPVVIRYKHHPTEYSQRFSRTIYSA